MNQSQRADYKQSHKNAETSDEIASVSRTDWPLDSQGDPLVEISFQCHELIGLERFGNITVGPARITTLVSMNDSEPFESEQLSNLTNALNKIAQAIEVDVVNYQYGVALEAIPPHLVPKS